MTYLKNLVFSVDIIKKIEELEAYVKSVIYD